MNERSGQNGPEQWLRRTGYLQTKVSVQLEDAGDVVHGPAIKDVSTMFTTKYRWVSYLSPNVSASYPVGIISSDYEGEEFSYYLL